MKSTEQKEAFKVLQPLAKEYGLNDEEIERIVSQLTFQSEITLDDSIMEYIKTKFK